MSDSISVTTDRTKRRAQETAQQKADMAKQELGRIAFDKLGDYFPEQAEERRRESRYQLILLGIALGLLLRHVMSRRP